MRTEASDHGAGSCGGNHAGEAGLRAVGADFLRGVRRSAGEAGAGEGDWGVRGESGEKRGRYPFAAWGLNRQKAIPFGYTDSLATHNFCLFRYQSLRASCWSLMEPVLLSLRLREV